MTLIGLGGKKRAGKDATAEILRDEFGFTVLGMSDALNDAMVTLNPIVNIESTVALRNGGEMGYASIRYARLAELVDYDEMKTVPEVRRLLQVFGTEVGRSLLGENIWVDVMKRRVHNLQIDYAIDNPGELNTDARIAVTGVRFQNELMMIGDLGGHSIYVDRPSLPSTTDTHASEVSLSPDNFDHVLVNDGTMSDLRDTVIEHMFERFALQPGDPSIEPLVKK